MNRKNSTICRKTGKLCDLGPKNANLALVTMINYKTDEKKKFGGKFFEKKCKKSKVLKTQIKTTILFKLNKK